MITHDPSLVILSATIAILGAFTACVMTSNFASLPQGEGRLRLAMASLALGGSLWAMQFVSLLAIEAPINWLRNPLLIVFSAIVCLGATTAALFMISRGGIGSGYFPLAVALLGLGIAAANYLGLGAVAGRGLKLSWFLVLISAAICIQMAGLVLWFTFRQRGVVVTLLAAIALGLGLTATHYVTVASVNGLAETLAAIPVAPDPVPERYLAWATTIMMYLVCSICLCIFVIMQFRDEIQEDR
jgi:NO-binding membrane sensor protein with MHYT domain